MGHGFGCGDGSCIDWHQRHVVREISAVCPLVYGVFVAAYGGHRGLGSRLGRLELFVFGFSLTMGMFKRSVARKNGNQQHLKTTNRPFRALGQSEDGHKHWIRDG